jgi:lipid II:glycine glycyltransferase (peptidoglycan interpeptide bridge formation enzyme)
VQAQCVRILDISKSADQLLSTMHPKTRYNINLAVKKGVTIGPGNIDDFLLLNRATRQRDKFRPHPDYYYQKMAETLGSDFLKIWQASYQNKVLTSVIIIYFDDTATYVHGASSDEHREVMAPHLLHWEIIKDAQAREFSYYDLGGVNPDDKNHPAHKKSWEGISRFKQSFGGDIVCYPDSFDLIYHLWWYRLYRLAKKFL